jgi:predicted nuclease with RNAse H fold
VLTVGVDLAAEPANTAVARIRWTESSAVVEAVGVGADDPALAEQIMVSDRAGIDCPLGWPRRFVEFVAEHQAGTLVVPDGIAGKDWRRQLALRQTDLAVRAETGLIPLSVAADRIGLAAMRCAALLARLAAAGQPVDRSGAGVVVEVYPAAALKHWGLIYRRYKGVANTAVRQQLVDALTAAAPWLSLSQHERTCRRSDHALDAVIAALNARAAALALTTRPSHEHLDEARAEGWIALPTCGLAGLIDSPPPSAPDLRPEAHQPSPHLNPKRAEHRR